MPSPLRVAILCPGLGIANRGFERAAQENHRALCEAPELDVRLVRGRAPAAEGEQVARTLSREAWLSRSVGRVTGRPDFWLEQLVFSAAVQPHLRRLAPDVVMLGEWTLTRALGLWRRARRQRFRLLLYNGAGAGPPYPDAADHVQQLTPDLFEGALAKGEPAERHTLLPHALEIPSRYQPPGDDERLSLRRRLGLPVDGKLLLTVGALNRWHKRMDYVVTEVASVSSRPHLVMLGARDDETPGVIELATRVLGPDAFTARTVPEDEMAGYYRAADLFALASGYEPFGLAMVEALAQGLPVIAHETSRTRYLLGEHGRLGDLARRGELAQLIEAALREQPAPARTEERHRWAYEMFSWDILRPRYVEMLVNVGGRR